MNQTSKMLLEEHDKFRKRIKELISQLYRQNVKDHTGAVMPEAALAEEWEYEGQEFNAITEQGLAHIVGKKIGELFTWDDLETEALLDVVHLLEDKEFVEN